MNKIKILKFIIPLFIYLLVNNCQSPQFKEKESQKPPAEEKAPEKNTHGLSLFKVKGMGELQILSSSEPEAEKINDNLIYFHVPIGGQNSMECSLIKGNDSPVYILKDLINKIKTNPGVRNFEILGENSGVMNKVPYISLEGSYENKDQEKGKMKSIALSSLGFVMLCYHDESGFNDAFMDSIQSISGSSLIKNLLSRIKKYESRSIQVVKLNENPIGYSENFVFKTGQIINYYSLSNFLVPRGKEDAYAGEIIEDLYAVEKTGSLTRADYYSSQNNVNEYKLDLVEVSPGVYDVKGSIKGQPFEKTVSSATGTASALEYELTKLMKSGKWAKGKKTKLFEYHPSFPDKLTSTTVEMISYGENIGEFTYTSGPVTMNYVCDSSGPVKIYMQNQNISMSWIRIFYENQ